MSLVRHANNRRVWRNLRDVFPHPYTDADADEWLGRAAAEPPPEGVYAIDVDGQAVGGISLERGSDVERHTAEIGYWLGEMFWGRGLMSAAVRTLSDAALRDQSNLYRLQAGVFAWNEASMRVLEKAGYQREGVMRRGVVKDGVLVDRVLYARTRDPGLSYAPFTAPPVRDSSCT